MTQSVLCPPDPFTSPPQAGPLSATIYSALPQTASTTTSSVPPLHSSSGASHTINAEQGNQDPMNDISQQLALQPLQGPGQIAGPPDQIAQSQPFDFEFLNANAQDWNPAAWPSEPWDALLQDMSSFNESTIAGLDLPWLISTPRVQESSERASEDVITSALLRKLTYAEPVCSSYLCLPFTLMPGIQSHTPIPHRCHSQLLVQRCSLIPLHPSRNIRSERRSS